MEGEKVIALVGNPNVGKSTVFNALTGMHQHTGNWTGKTVDTAKGTFKYNTYEYTIIDLPGTYSLLTKSLEEEVTKEYIESGVADVILVVCDASCLERNLNLFLQISEINKNIILCINLMDEAEKKGIRVDTKKLSQILGVKVVPTSARRKKGIEDIKIALENVTKCTYTIDYEGNSAEEKIKKTLSCASKIAREVVTYTRKSTTERDEKIDRLLTGKYTGFFFMLIFLVIILFITINLANYPSQLLSKFFAVSEKWLYEKALLINTPLWLCQVLLEGVYRVVGWIIAVMLPPMAIFFPLFTLLEDWGYLPRIAFNLDRPFRKCGSCGKQALTMCMGFGCNAVGVSGARIIDLPKQRLIAILTNALVPCNGRFPTIIALITIFFVGTGAYSGVISTLFLSFFIVLGILATFFISFILSKTILKEKEASFVLELPSYRPPLIFKTLVRSIFDRTIFVLLRAISISAPAGLIIWLLANIQASGITLLEYVSSFLNPFAVVFGLDGVIIMAFILGMPANEIVLPIALMAYLQGNTITDISETIRIGEILISNGWTTLTAINVIILSLFHSPCLTTLLTIKKETKSIKWTILSFVIPTALGLFICFLTNLIYSLIF